MAVVIDITNLGKRYRVYHSPFGQVVDLLGLSSLVPRSKPLFNEVWALRGFELTIESGERLGIIGENGAGKSTLLKIIAGKVPPTEGRIFIKGDVQALFEAGIGFHPEFTGRENIRASLAYRNLSTSLIRKYELDVLEFAELDSFIDQPLKTYSAGMVARLAFATATCLQPDVLIVDEVLGAGDAYFAGKSMERMRRLTEQENVTVLFVSHDLSSIQRLCTRVIWLRQGNMLMSGKPHEVIKEYIDFIDKKTDMRLRAKEMQLSRHQAQVFFGGKATQQTYLLRLHSDGAKPGRSHLIREARIVNNDQFVARLHIGGPSDSVNTAVNYIIEEKPNNNWGDPVQSPTGAARQYGDFGGRDRHAPFVLSIPKILSAEESFIALEIEHEPTGDDPVFIDFWSEMEKKYCRLGSLKQAGNTHNDWVVSRFALPGHQQRMTLREDENQLSTETSADNKLASQDKELEDQPIKISEVDFLDGGHKSTRVFEAGSDLKILIKYNSIREVYEPVFAVTIFGLDGVQMTHHNTRLLNKPINKVVRGQGIAEFEFSPCRIGPGEYLVTVAILKYFDLENWHGLPPAFDRHDRRYMISIRSDTKLFKNLGLVIQDCRFQHKQRNLDAAD